LARRGYFVGFLNDYPKDSTQGGIPQTGGGSIASTDDALIAVPALR